MFLPQTEWENTQEVLCALIAPTGTSINGHHYSSLSCSPCFAPSPPPTLNLSNPRTASLSPLRPHLPLLLSCPPVPTPLTPTVASEEGRKLEHFTKLRPKRAKKQQSTHPAVGGLVAPHCPPSGKTAGSYKSALYT